MLLFRPSWPRRPFHLLLQRPCAALFGLPATQKVLAEAAAMEGGSLAAVFNWKNTVDAEMVYMDVADEPALRRRPSDVLKGIELGARNLFDDLQKQTVKVIASIVMFERRLTLKGYVTMEKTEMWIEFAKRSVAKRVANLLNGEQIVAKKYQYKCCLFRREEKVFYLL